MRCDCGEQLDEALRLMCEEGGLDLHAAVKQLCPGTGHINEHNERVGAVPNLATSLDGITSAMSMRAPSPFLFRA